MSNDWKELSAIYSVRLKNNDNWEYKLEAYSDVLVIEYWYDDKKENEFNIPVFCSKQVLQEALNLIDKIEEELK